MYKKIISGVILLTMLSGCAKGGTEGSAVISETEMTSAEVSESTFTTVTTVSTVVSEEMETTSAETSLTEPPYTEDGKPPAVMPAEELFDAYPVKIIYHERQDVSDKVKTEVLREDICNPEGLKTVEFYAEYPVLSGYDEAVCKKINDTVKAFIDENYNNEKSWTESYKFDTNETLVVKEYGTPILKYTINMDGTYFDGFGYDINGNIFSVYFAENYVHFQAAHGSENPVPMMFDLRTGDKIVFSELVGDKDKMQVVFAKTERRGELLHGTAPFGERDADEMQEILSPPYKGFDEFYKDDRIIAVDGCIGFILAPYEAGSFADGVRLWRLPASEFIPYMNDKGKTLFEGYVSAETEPPKVVEYKGKRYFDNTEWIPLTVENLLDRDEFGKQLTEYDREFAALFENAGAYDKERYGLTAGEE